MENAGASMSKNDIIEDQGPIIVFDAMCVLCSANARFVLRHDHGGRFRFASMQNETGAALYRRCGIDPTNPDSLIIVEGANVLRDSDAVLAIYARENGQGMFFDENEDFPPDREDGGDGPEPPSPAGGRPSLRVVK